jgi:hypothetical protein
MNDSIPQAMMAGYVSRRSSQQGDYWNQNYKYVISFSNKVHYPFPVC